MAAALERALGSVTEPGEAAAAAPLLVLGPAGSGRTSLLLRAALAGGGDGPRALFLAPSGLPRLPGGGDDPRALQRLELRYPPSRGALRGELGALASHPRPPGLLLVDGLERYLEEEEEEEEEKGGPSPGTPARLAALLLETSRSPGPPTQVLASFRLPPAAPHVLPALRRYFPAECRLRPVTGTPQLQIRARLARPGAPHRRWRLRFGPHGQLHVGHDDEGDDEEDGDEAWG